MAWNSRSSHKHLLLHVWCGLLTVAVLALAALLISIKASKTTQVEVASLRPGVSPTVNTAAAPFKGSPPSHIQLRKSADNLSWQETEDCGPGHLVFHEGSIHCRKDSLYFLYAQVAFAMDARRDRKSVLLIRNPAYGKSSRILAEGTFPPTAEGSVWVAKMVRLRVNDKVSINITGEFLSGITVWGAYELQ